MTLTEQDNGRTIELSARDVLTVSPERESINRLSMGDRSKRPIRTN
jgi:hypothetical protein